MKAVMDIEQLKLICQKLELYRKQEDILFHSISDTLTHINQLYASPNKEFFEDFQWKLMRKFKVVNQRRNIDMKVLLKNIEKYTNGATEIEIGFDNIKGE